MVARETPKLVAKFDGPYKILDKIGHYPYKLDLPPSYIIHPIFHVSQLKAVVVANQVATSLPPSALPMFVLKPLAILDHRTVKEGNKAVT